MSWENDAKRIKYENDLINHRLTWLGVFEGLLFVAYRNPPHPSWLLPLVGIVIALSVDHGIRLANRKLTALGEQGNRFFFMPGSVIPKVIAIAWVVILAASIWWPYHMAPRGY
jgi:hypothetical protein